jgi:hypothetical protein
MYETTATTKVLRLRRSAARKARVALAATAVAAAFVVLPLVAGLVAPPAHASTTLIVTNTNDSGAGSLRQAILDANATADADVINFAIPGTGVQTIKPSTPLPPITQQVSINGYTQPGSSANTKAVGDDAVLKVQLDGANVPTGSGLEISGASGSAIRGLVIAHFGEGIDISGGSVGSRVEGNFIGTDPSGTLAPGNHFDGVFIEDGASRIVVGGSTPDKRNLISGSGSGGNGSFGVLVGENTNGSRIEGNYIGTDGSGTKALGNDGAGVQISGAASTRLGGATAASGNVISGNHAEGVEVVDSHGTEVLGNRIGTTASGTAALGNALAGVQLFGGSTFNSVGAGTAGGSNTIAFNGGDGVEIAGTSAGNGVSRNSVFSNGGLGIDLLGPGEIFSTTNVSTPNDAGDGDSGPNDLQNKPVLASAKTISGTTTIKGTLDTLPLADAAYTVEFFSNTSGNEGKTLVGAKTLKTDRTGHAAFIFTPATAVSVGKTITATATSDVTLDASEFSAPRTVASS